MGVFKAIFRIIIGVVLGFASGLALSPAIAALANQPGDSSWLIWLVTAIGGVLGFFAPTIRRAFGRGFLLLGVSTFALPLSVMVLSGRVTGDMMQQAEAGGQGTAALGGAIAGTMMTGAAAFIGFFLGAIFLVIGLVLVLGGRREVVVVNQYPPDTRYAHRPDGTQTAQVIEPSPSPAQVPDMSKWSKRDREAYQAKMGAAEPKF